MEDSMNYNRVISRELEATLKDDDKLKWLYDFVKSREDLDFLIGANKSIEWISVYRGLSRIIRIFKAKSPDSIVKIDGAEAYMTLAGSLKKHIYTDNLDSCSNFEDHLMTLLDRVSNDKKYDRYYKNKKEGYYQNILSRKYGINSLPDSDFVIIDKEVVIGYEDQKEKDKIFGMKQNKYKSVLKDISRLDPIRFGKDLEKKAIGNELDFLAWKSDGTLLLVELKHWTNTSGIYLSPLQIGLYAEIFENYKEKDETDFYNSLKRMVEQKQRMGLIHKDWKIPTEIKSINPMLIISEYNPKSTGMEKFFEVLPFCRKQFGDTHLRDIDVRSYSYQQDKLELIFPDIEDARQLFQKAGLDLPAIPGKLAVRLEKRSDRDFSTRVIPKSPNYLNYYVDEANNTQVADYVILSTAINSPSRHAIHYFLVIGPLRMFLQLFYGSTYMEDDEFALQVAQIRECFALADQIIAATMAVCKAGDRLTIVCTNDGGSYWVAPGQSFQEEQRYLRNPAELLREALQWLKSNVAIT